MKYFYYDKSNHACVKEKYRKNSYKLNEIDLNMIQDVEELIKDFQEIFQKDITERTAFIQSLGEVSVYGRSGYTEIYIHNIKNTKIIEKLLYAKFKIETFYKRKFKASKKYEKLSDEAKLMLELL